MVSDRAERKTYFAPKFRLPGLANKCTGHVTEFEFQINDKWLFRISVSHAMLGHAYPETLCSCPEVEIQLSILKVIAALS